MQVPSSSTDLTLLLTDVVDSTLLNGQVGDATMARLWAAHDRAARELMQRCRGREVGRSDGFLVLFDHPDNALAFALAYHRALDGLEVPMRSRVGIHLGPVELRRNSPEDVACGATPFEVDGLALPTAARMMSAAGAGQTLLSRAAADALSPHPWRTLSHGHWRLKGLPDPVEFIEIGQADAYWAPFEPPPDAPKAYRVVEHGDQWVSARELPNNLPSIQDLFVGRRDELQRLGATIDQGARLVTLLGIGGIGKTRLAQRFARAWLGDFPGGAWFCDLSNARTLDGVVHAVAQALDVPLGKGEPVQQLGAALAGRGRCLVILDNFEQVARHAAATLGRWLERSQQAVFMVTSRELLGLTGEHTLLLEPLAADEARSLFSSRMAMAEGPGQTSGTDELQAIDALVELIDRLPLAIELAAARARVIPPREQVQRMGERFKLLASRSGRHDRQATMRAALDWGWELLPAPEQEALAQLTAFAGGFTLAAAEAVLDVPGESWVPDLVQALVEKSWLRRTGSGRLDMLGTVKHYCGEHLQRGASDEAVQRRHWRYHAGFTEVQAIADRCVELENLVIGCQEATAARDDEAAGGCLLGAWAALRLTGPLGAAVALAEPLLALPNLRAGLRLQALWVAGSALYLQGHVDCARASLQPALSEAEPGSATAARIGCVLGELESTAGDPGHAQRLLTDTLTWARAHGDAPLQCRALNGLGALATDASRWDEALGLYSAGLALARAHDLTRWAGVLLGNLGALCHFQGQRDAAADHYEQAIKIAHEIGDRRGEGDRRSNLGLLMLEQGRHVPAQAELQRALAIARSTGHVRLQGAALCNIGLAWEALGDAAQALAAFEEAVVLAKGLHDERGEAQHCIYLGRCLARQHRDEAGACLARAQTLLAASADPSLLGLLHCALAESATARGAPAEARALLDQAEMMLWQSGAGPDAELGKEVQRLRAMDAARVSLG